MKNRLRILAFSSWLLIADYTKWAERFSETSEKVAYVRKKPRKATFTNNRAFRTISVMEHQRNCEIGERQQIRRDRRMADRVKRNVPIPKALRQRREFHDGGHAVV